MSDNNTDDVVVEPTADIYDYLDVQETPVVEEPKEEVVEDKNDDDDVKEETEATPSDDEVKEDEGQDKPDEDEHKPWKADKKSETPAWARKRFKEYSTTVRDLKQQNIELMETVKQILNQNKPQDSQLTKADFADEDAYLDYRAEQIAKQQLAEYEKTNKENAEAEAQRTELRTAEQKNIEKAATDLPDYNEVIMNGDPEVTLPQNVLSHLAMSPAGPYTKYRIAADEALSDSIKNATPQEKIRIVSELHDSILDVLIKRGNIEQTAPAPVEEPAQPVRTPAAPTAPKKKSPPKAPPKVKSGTVRDMMSLDGDAYVRARNEMLRKR